MPAVNGCQKQGYTVLIASTISVEVLPNGLLCGKLGTADGVHRPRCPSPAYDESVKVAHFQVKIESGDVLIDVSEH